MTLLSNSIDTSSKKSTAPTALLLTECSNKEERLYLETKAAGLHNLTVAESKNEHDNHLLIKKSF